MTTDSTPARDAVPPRADRRLPRALVVVLVLLLLGLWARPDGAAWVVAYDVVLYCTLYTIAAVWSWRASRPAGRASSGRWLSAAIVLNGAGSVVYTLAVAPERLPLALACCALGCLMAVLVRTALTVRELRRLRDAGREARTDELTGLPNRRALLERAADAMAGATPDRPLALLLLDLDGFKGVNDRLGHSAGDELLRQVGARMHRAVRPTDTLARLGGDEFAVVLPDTREDVARRVAVGLRETLRDTFTVDGVPLRARVSIGIATAPVAAPTLDALLRRADAAMYVAKDLDEGVHVHTDEAVGDHVDRLPTRADLRAALADGDLTVHLRPRMSLHHGRTVAVAALARWEHPSRGMLEAHDLLRVAERAGLQARLAATVLDVALATAARWWSHRSPLPVVVDLAGADLGDVDLPGTVAAALARHRLPPRALMVEVVEETLARAGGRGRGVVTELRSMGVAVSVGRFGTGWAPLATVRHLPVDQLTLDPALVADLATGARAASVVRHTVALAHALDLRVVAGGVGDTATLGALAELGCDVVEGAVVAPAMPVEALLRWLDDRPADTAVGVRLVRPTAEPLAALAG